MGGGRWDWWEMGLVGGEIGGRWDWWEMGLVGGGIGVWWDWWEMGLVGEVGLVGGRRLILKNGGRLSQTPPHLNLCVICVCC